MRGELDQARSLGQIQTSVTNLRQEDGVDLVVMLEILQDTKTFLLRSRTVNICLAELPRVLLQCVDVVREDDNLVASRFVVVDQELTSLKLLRVHDRQQCALLQRRRLELFRVELRCHLTPHFRTLHFRNVPLFGKLLLVGFVQLGSNEEVEIVNLVVLSEKGGSQTKLRM
jgi:hypothetical protein